MDGEKCPKCDGDRCPYCLQTGKRLYEIGEEVIWDNQEGSLAPSSVREETYRKHVGRTYRVNALMNLPGSQDRYYVGIDVEMETVLGGTCGALVFDTNLRRPHEGNG